ncbi:MAG: FAD-binding oxidoreductase [Chloroflexia bacterium]|nr:FAD-binding oxidoreductase [Chloroflexia bacterium]
MRQSIPRRRDASELPASTPVVIVGGGIVGVASAWFLRQYGLEAIVVEAAHDIGVRTTAMSAHCIRAQFSDRDNIAMMAESLDFYEHFNERLGTDRSDASIGLCQQGYLFASTDPADTGVFASRIATQRAAGLDDVELLTGEEARQRFPWLSDEIAVATFRSRDGWIDSRLAVEAIAAAAQVPIFLNVSASEILVEAGAVIGVNTSAGTIATDTVVIAAGPFSRELSPEPLPISLWRRHRLIVAANSAIPQTGPVTIDANSGSHWRPHRGGALLAWAQPETDQPAQWPVQPDPEFVELILQSEGGVGRLAPFWNDLRLRLRSSEILLTAGQYTMTPDHRPLIGAAPRTRGLYLNTGYSGHGIMGAPAGARILAEAMTRSNDGSHPFAPNRFDGQTDSPDIEQVVI